MISYKVDFARIPWAAGIPGIRYKAFSHGSSRLRLVEYTEEMEPHWCHKGHIGCILEGRFEIGFSSETLEYGPGDGVFIPPGSEHRHKARVIAGPVRALFVEES